MKAKQNLPIDFKLASQAAEFSRALDNKTRQTILKFIHEQQPVRVKAIYKKLKMEQSITSAHLAILRKVNVVNNERIGVNVEYSINYDQLEYLQDAFKRIVRAR